MFTGLPPDLATMRDIVRKALSPLTKALDPEDEGRKPADEKKDGKPAEGKDDGDEGGADEG